MAEKCFTEEEIDYVRRLIVTSAYDPEYDFNDNGIIDTYDLGYVKIHRCPGTCSTDADCVEGFVCIDGTCVKTPLPPGPSIPPGLILLALVGAFLLTR